MSVAASPEVGHTFTPTATAAGIHLEPFTSDFWHSAQQDRVPNDEGGTILCDVSLRQHTLHAATSSLSVGSGHGEQGRRYEYCG